MHCIIPAAGKGKRMRPLTWSTPKPLLPVAGRPMLAHVMETLIEAGVHRITLIVGYLGDQIVDWARREYPGIEVNFALQEKADGLASAVLLAEEHADEGPTMVVLGDTLFSADLSHLRKETRNLIVTSPVDDPSRFGVVVMKDGRVTELIEKPETPVSRQAIVGVYFFRSGNMLMEYCRKLKRLNKRTRGEFQLTDAMQLMLENGEPFGTMDISGWYDCGKPETLIETNRELLRSGGGGGCPMIENSVIIEPCVFGKNTLVLNSVVGPFFSGADNITIENSLVADTIAGNGSRFSGVSLCETVTGCGVTVRNFSGSLFLGDDSVVDG